MGTSTLGGHSPLRLKASNPSSPCRACHVESSYARPVFRPPLKRSTVAAMVDIHLFAHGSSIPTHSFTDIQRLSMRPFKWLCFVLSAICGTLGELYATLCGRNPVDYHST